MVAARCIDARLGLQLDRDEARAGRGAALDLPLALPRARLGGAVPGVAPRRPADPVAARAMAAHHRAGAFEYHRLEHAGRLRADDDSLRPRLDPGLHDAGARDPALGLAAERASHDGEGDRPGARACRPRAPAR